MNNTFSLSDNVIARIVQILQEGLMTGTDITDHMRMIRVETDDEGKLQLSADYVKQVNEGYEKLNAEMLEKMKASNE
jgi:hypothetical protein